MQYKQLKIRQTLLCAVLVTMSYNEVMLRLDFWIENNAWK